MEPKRQRARRWLALYGPYVYLMLNPCPGRQVVGVVWALASSRTHAPELYQRLARVAHPVLEGFTLNELTGVAWAFRYSNYSQHRGECVGSPSLAKILNRLT